MKAVFADTSFYVAVLSPRDAYHASAESSAHTIRGRVITTEYVLLEVATFFSAMKNRATFLELLRVLRNDPETKLLPSSADLWQRGLSLFAERMDKDWSLTDCISFVVMQDLELREALTTDHHFEQAGFVALLK
jgi:predicted nucleic acid-binding protein